MYLVEPPPSPGDLRFQLFGVPVRVHPFFWVVTALLGLSSSGETRPGELLSWVAVVFVSILVHELGHAFLQRRYGGHPWITLYGFGGLASCEDCDRRPRSQILISLAGPMAGFLLAALVIAAVRIAGHPVGWTAGSEIPWEQAGIDRARAVSIVGSLVYWQPFAATSANEVFGNLIFVNILWGLVNLLPVYPLDGGRVSRELCTLNNPRRGIVVSLWISTIAAAAMAVVALVLWRTMFTGLFFGYLAYSSYAARRAYQARW